MVGEPALFGGTAAPEGLWGEPAVFGDTAAPEGHHGGEPASFGDTAAPEGAMGVNLPCSGSAWFVLGQSRVLGEGCDPEQAGIPLAGNGILRVARRRDGGTVHSRCHTAVPALPTQCIPG